MNRYITDEISTEQQILIKLEDLKSIVGLFPLEKKINNRDVFVIMPF